MFNMRKGLILTAVAVVMVVAAGALAIFLTKDDSSDGGTESAQPSPEPSSSTSSEPEPDPTAERLVWGPTDQQLDQAQKLASDMSDEELAGQVIVTNFAGTEPENAAQTVRDYHLAGVILMGDNIASADQISEVSAAVRDEQKSAGRDWPPIISVDQEGGRVARLSDVIGSVPTFWDLAHEGEDAIRDALTDMTEDMTELGFTMDFAPSADITIGEEDPTIGDRAADTEPEPVSEAVQVALETFLDGGIVPTVKHFPGHGSVTSDSHETLPVQDKSLDDLREWDFVPFVDAIEDGAPVVMVGHLNVEDLDEGVPSSLSQAAYDLLRDDMGFEGVTVTDALNMAGVADTVEEGQEAVDALAAGADLLLMPSNVASAHEAIINAMDAGDIDRADVEESAARVIAMQMWFDDGLPRD